jgi:hypothetical protein
MISNMLLLRFMSLVLRLLIRINYGSQDRKAGLALRKDIDGFLSVINGEMVAEALIR